ncbi:hypothetical protein [Catenovulum agarivorans]|uniref:hypothetical protein n=1 Tax=Catenovulum agarivorans TaxID=1172192 RepID=UPI00036BADD3|nr:hypothetical protein [Catenovulum agarivorans]
MMISLNNFVFTVFLFLGILSTQAFACIIENNAIELEVYEKIKTIYGRDVCDTFKKVATAKKLPLIDIKMFEYEGGFRLSPKNLIQSDNFSNVDFSYGVMTYDSIRNSIFISGNPKYGSIIEFAMPEIVKSKNIQDFVIVETSRQPYFRFYNPNDVASKKITGIDGFFRITGIGKLGRSLIVNYINWYDANANEADTSIVITDAHNMAASEIKGPYQIEGAARASGWITPIPEFWQDLLGGSHILGNQPYASIISRLSVGPSAFAFYPRPDMVYSEARHVPSVRLLDFPLKNFLKLDQLYGDDVSTRAILNNEMLNNDLWTVLSGAAIGFIVPNTRTYVTIGKSGGHKSGVGYKIQQLNSGSKNTCGGSCARDFNDNGSYYWMWDAYDLFKVRLGLMEPFEVRPYDYGYFEVPVGNDLLASSGAYDTENNRLFLSFRSGDTLGRFARPPLILTYKLNI